MAIQQSHSKAKSYSLAFYQGNAHIVNHKREKLVSFMKNVETTRKEPRVNLFKQFLLFLFT